MPQKKKYRLFPELVPSDLWGRSAFKMLGSGPVWKKKIRPDAIAAANNVCEICGSEGRRLICHEKWNYDDKTALATLQGFEIHCVKCDQVTHFKRAMTVGDPQSVLIEVGQQLCDVNECHPVVAAAIINAANDFWESRNKKKWKIAVARKLLKKYPELVELPSFKPSGLQF